MPCECGEGRPDGCERECRGGEGSVGEASCFWWAFVVVGDARSYDEKPVGVDAVWGAGHKGGLIGAGVVFVYPGEIVGGDGADCLHLIGEGFAEGGDGEFVTFSGLVEFGSQLGQQGFVCLDDGIYVPHEQTRVPIEFSTFHEYFCQFQFGLFSEGFYLVEIITGGFGYLYIAISGFRTVGLDAECQQIVRLGNEVQPFFDSCQKFAFLQD